MNSILPRTAYILQIHKNPEQVNLFIKQLISGGQADVYIHIDKKSYESINSQLLNSPYVKVLSESVNCEWGDIGQVNATLLLLQEVIASGKKYDFVCLRSGQDLLIQNGFKGFLKENKNHVFMKSRKLTKSQMGLMKINWPIITRKRYANFHPIRFFRSILLGLYRMGLNLLPNRNYFPDEFEIYKGSQWFSIPIEVAEYILNFLNENKWYHQFFENTLVPDESFFHTIIMNSPYKNVVVNQNLFYMKWGVTMSERNSPQFLRKEDISKIKDSKMFFARKFDMNVDREIVVFFSENMSFGEKDTVQKLEA